jgi:hypothetical protein
VVVACTTAANPTQGRSDPPETPVETPSAIHVEVAGIALISAGPRPGRYLDEVEPQDFVVKQTSEQYVRFELFRDQAHRDVYAEGMRRLASSPGTLTDEIISVSKPLVEIAGHLAGLTDSGECKFEAKQIKTLWTAPPKKPKVDPSVSWKPEGLVPAEWPSNYQDMVVEVTADLTGVGYDAEYDGRDVVAYKKKDHRMRGKAIYKVGDGVVEHKLKVGGGGKQVELIIMIGPSHTRSPQP